MRGLRSLRGLLLAGVATLCAAWLAWYILGVRRANESLASAASRAQDYLANGDVGRLLELVHEHEKEMIPLDYARLDRLYRWYVDCMADLKPVGRRVDLSGLDGYILVGTQEYRSQSGAWTMVELTLDRTPKGPRLYITKPLVFSALVAKYGRLFASDPPRIQVWKSIEHGISAEKPFFDSIQLHGFAETSLEPKLITWDQLLNISRRSQTLASKTQ